jgi:hypothetical protein
MKEGRIHIRCDEKLANQMRKYAKKKRTTLSAIIEEHFRFLLELEKVSNGLRKGEQGVAQHAVSKRSG